MRNWKIYTVSWQILGCVGYQNHVTCCIVCCKITFLHKHILAQLYNGRQCIKSPHIYTLSYIDNHLQSETSIPVKLPAQPSCGQTSHPKRATVLTTNPIAWPQRAITYDGSNGKTVSASYCNDKVDQFIWRRHLGDSTWGGCHAWPPSKLIAAQIKLQKLEPSLAPTNRPMPSALYCCKLRSFCPAKAQSFVRRPCSSGLLEKMWTSVGRTPNPFMFLPSNQWSLLDSFQHPWNLPFLSIAGSQERLIRHC